MSDEELLGRHVREAATPMQDGTLLADCSCGGTYSVAQGAREYERLEAERLAHARQTEGQVSE